MVTYLVGADKGGDAQNATDAVVAALKAKGKDAQALPIGPNKEQTRNEHDSNYILIFCVNGGQAGATWSSFAKYYQPGMAKTLVAYEGWIGNEHTTSAAAQTEPLIMEHDSTDFYQPWMDAMVEGHTIITFVQKYNDCFAGFCVSDISPEDLGQKIANGECDNLSSAVVAEGGSATKIPDFTFYGLIRQICGAVDAVFIIANNLAYLISFKDYYDYRIQYEDLIPRLNSMHILSNTLTKNWTTDGFYNTVSVTYAEGTLTYQHDALVQQYGQQIFYYEFPDDDEETAKAKAQALLSAHVRDYSLDLTLTCLYDPQITEGAWIKVSKTLTKTTYEKQVPTRHLSETEEWVEGNATPTEEKEYEIYFVQGYTVKWDSTHSLTMDLHLKYGPDTPEDPVNAQVGGGGTTTTGGGGGGYGDDCFSEDDLCPTGDTRAGLNSGADALERARAQPPSSENYMPRAKQGSTYDNDYKGMSGEEAYYKMSGEWHYSKYADANPDYPCVADLYDTNPHIGINCADSTRMYKVIADVIGIKCWGWHIDNHYFNCIENGGEIETLDIVRGPGGSVNTTHSIGWPRNPSY